MLSTRQRFTTPQGTGRNLQKNAPGTLGDLFKVTQV